jgi:hypothetical protein
VSPKEDWIDYHRDEERDRPDTALADGKRVRICCGRHGACQRPATYPEGDPFLCSPCAIIDGST